MLLLYKISFANLCNQEPFNHFLMRCGMQVLFVTLVFLFGRCEDFFFLRNQLMAFVNKCFLFFQTREDLANHSLIN